jgi:hypothetical protein
VAVPALERVFIVLIVFLLLGLGGYFGWRQRKILALARGASALSPADRSFLSKQAYRRILNSVLMAVLAGFLIGWFFLEEGFLELRPGNAGEAVDRDAAQQWLNFYVFYWIATLVVFFGILFLAALDLVATARYGLRQHRQLESERRAMMEAEAAKLRARREERN